MLWKHMAGICAVKSDQVEGAVVEFAVVIKELVTEGNVVNYCQLVGKVLEGIILDPD